MCTVFLPPGDNPIAVNIHKLKDECGSSQSSDRTLSRVEFSNSKFGFVIADYLLSHPNII